MPIFPLLLLLFFSVPLLEIYLLLKVSGDIGILWTIFLVILTAVLGSILIRMQSFSLLMQSRQKLSHGQMPTDAVFSGACLLLAGALLLTPGFFTDFIGFLLLTPFLRGLAYKYLVSRFKSSLGAGPSTNQYTHSQSDVIEGEFSETSDSEKKQKNLP